MDGVWMVIGCHLEFFKHIGPKKSRRAPGFEKIYYEMYSCKRFIHKRYSHFLLQFMWLKAAPSRLQGVQAACPRATKAWWPGLRRVRTRSIPCVHPTGAAVRR